MTDDPELSIVRRAFPEAQRLLDGAISSLISPALDVGWHDTSVSAESGAAALVRSGGPHEDLVGEVLKVTSVYGSAFVYVVGKGPLVTDLSLARRAFLAIGPLAEESLSSIVELV